MSRLILFRDRPGRRWFKWEGRRYTVTFQGPGWGWVVRDPAGRDVGEYFTLTELREKWLGPED